MEFYTLIGIILAVVGLAAAVPSLKNMAKSLGMISEDELCRLSVITATKSKSVPTSMMGGGKPITPLECKRQTLMLRKKDVVEGSKLNQEKAQKLIAEELRKCWWKMGEGKFDPFASTGTTHWDESYCAICSVIKFDDELKEFMREKAEKDPSKVEEYAILGFMPYMMKNGVPKKKISYYQYLFGKPPTQKQWEVEVEKAKKSIVLPDSTVVYRTYKAEEGSSLKYILGLAAVGVGIAVTIIFPPAAAFGAGLVFLGKAALVLGVVGGAAGLIYTSAYCVQCEGYPSLVFVPGNQFFDEPVTFSYVDKEGDKVEKTSALCNILVN